MKPIYPNNEISIAVNITFITYKFKTQSMLVILAVHKISENTGTF